MDLHLEVDREHEAFATAGVDRPEVRVELVCVRDRLCPVQRQDCGGNYLRPVHARIERVLPGSERVAPDPAMTGSHDRAELELDTGCVLRRQAEVGLDHGNLTLVHHEHRHALNVEQERVQQE
jgi:hypothetical protein